MLRCNELARQMVNMELIASIDRQLDFGSLKVMFCTINNILTYFQQPKTGVKGKFIFSQKVPIVNQERSLVKKGTLTQLVKPQRHLHVNVRGTEKKVPIHIFLFSDLILVTKLKEKE